MMFLVRPVGVLLGWVKELLYGFFTPLELGVSFVCTLKTAY